MSTPERIVAGVNLPCVTDIRSELTKHTEIGFDFLVVPLVHPRLQRTFTHAPKRTDPLTRFECHVQQRQGRRERGLSASSPCECSQAA